MFMTRVKFCGDILEAGTRRAAPSKTEPIDRWSTEHIRTPTDMKAFLGLTQWYSIYMPNYAHWAAILSHSLTGMGCSVKQSKRQMQHRRIKSTDEMIEAFEGIKELRRNSLMLQIPDVTKPFLIRTDASQYAVGALLEQEDDQGNFRPVAFFSRKLQGKDNLGQRAWSTREKETYALIGALHKFRSWIHSTVLVRSLVDHQALISWFREDLGTISGPVGRRERWHEFLSQFHIQVEYTPGKGHIVPDTLSRWAYLACEHAGDAKMHGCVPDREGVHIDESESRKWEDKVISEHIFRRLGEERAALASVRLLRASWDNEQMEHPGIALKEDNQFSARLAGMLSSPEKILGNHIKRVHCVVKRMQAQCWGYESAFLPAHISGISNRTRSRSGQSHENFPAQHHVDQDWGRDSVAGGHLNLAAVQSASDDAHDAPGSEQFLPSAQGDTSVLFSDWTEEYKADPELKELFEYLQKGTRGTPPSSAAGWQRQGPPPPREGEASSPRSAASTWQSTRCSATATGRHSRRRERGQFHGNHPRECRGPGDPHGRGGGSPSSTSTDRRQAAPHGRKGRRSGPTYKCMPRRAASVGDTRWSSPVTPTSAWMPPPTRPRSTSERAGRPAVSGGPRQAAWRT